MRLTKVRGVMVGARAVSEDMELFVISSSGIVIRTPAKKISRQKREASGVKVMNLPAGDNIAAFAVVIQEENEVGES